MTKKTKGFRILKAVYVCVVVLGCVLSFISIFLNIAILYDAINTGFRPIYVYCSLFMAFGICLATGLFLVIWGVRKTKKMEYEAYLQVQEAESGNNN